jgi:MarR family transcriptional regulator, organic hydroperoxide resistance regulator
MSKPTQGGFYISQIKQIQSRVFEKLLRENDIDDFNGAQGRILFVLWQEDHLTIHELGQRTSLAKTTLTGMLDRMEKQDHLRRSPDPDDRRQIRIGLTEKARASYAKYQSVSAQMSDIFYQNLSSEEITQFETTLAKVLNNLKEYEEK